jgi:uncharacterized protein (DUF1330 family)
MSAYLVFIRERTLDAAELEIYWSEIRSTFVGHEVKVLASYGAHEDLEGPATEGTVIAEFPSMEAAKRWYDSPAYKKVRIHRQKGAVYRGILVQGL